MKRSKGMQDFLDDFSRQEFGVSNTAAGIAMICVFCKKPVEPEKMSSDMHRREWEISRICEQCQDDTFGKKG